MAVILLHYSNFQGRLEFSEHPFGLAERKKNESLQGKENHNRRESGETAKLVIVLFNEGVTLARELFESLAVQILTEPRVYAISPFVCKLFAKYQLPP